MSLACGNCGHPDTIHLRNAAEKFGCMSAYSGTSTSGIIGEPYTVYCSCSNFTTVLIQCRVCHEIVYPASERTRPRSERWEGAQAEVRKADEPVHLRCAEGERIRTEIDKTVDPKWLAEFRKKHGPKKKKGKAS